MIFLLLFFLSFFLSFSLSLHFSVSFPYLYFFFFHYVSIVENRATAQLPFVNNFFRFGRKSKSSDGGAAVTLRFSFLPHPFFSLSLLFSFRLILGVCFLVIFEGEVRYYSLLLINYCKNRLYLMNIRLCRK
jgi:hypothetical protein